jgi:hypothetical protein
VKILARETDASEAVRASRAADALHEIRARDAALAIDGVRAAKAGRTAHRVRAFGAVDACGAVVASRCARAVYTECRFAAAFAALARKAADVGGLACRWHKQFSKCGFELGARQGVRSRSVPTTRVFALAACARAAESTDRADLGAFGFFMRELARWRLCGCVTLAVYSEGIAPLRRPRGLSFRQLSLLRGEGAESAASLEQTMNRYAGAMGVATEVGEDVLGMSEMAL